MNPSEIEEIRKELKLIRHTTDEINLAVTGDTKLGIKGLGKRTTSLEEWRDKLNVKVAYTAGIVSGITFGGLEGVKALVSALKHH